jgi:MscS family membrane protein
VGDFCQVADQMGTVEDIGLRSTKIRTLSRTVVAVPNGQLASTSIENFSQRDKFRFHHTIGVRYETSADQTRYLLAKIRSLLHAHPRIERDGARIRFVGLGASSLDLEVSAYVRAADKSEFLAIQEDLLLRILDLVAESGTSIAFPSQTTYFVRDTPVDGEQREHAEAHVRAWRDRGELPFPDFGPRQAADLQVAVEYPPEGSVLRNS